MQQWIDVHTHINMSEGTPEQIKDTALRAGVKNVITIGTGPEDNKLVLNIAKKYYPFTFCALGMHPHDAKNFNEDVINFIKQNYKEAEVVGVGEIGLDYYYDYSDRDIQKTVFRKMIELAIEIGLPIEVHTRDAEEDTVEILSDYRDQVKRAGVVFYRITSRGTGSSDNSVTMLQTTYGKRYQ